MCRQGREQGLERGREERKGGRAVTLLVKENPSTGRYTLNVCSRQGWVRAKLRVRNPMWAFFTRDRNPLRKPQVIIQAAHEQQAGPEGHHSTKHLQQKNLFVVQEDKQPTFSFIYEHLS